MPELSKQAQNIINSAVEATGGYGRPTPGLYWKVAAALRAASLVCKRDNLILLSLAEELELFGEGPEICDLVWPTNVELADDD